jgi:hypothetical protein
MLVVMLSSMLVTELFLHAGDDMMMLFLLLHPAADALLRVRAMRVRAEGAYIIGWLAMT